MDGKKAMQEFHGTRGINQLVTLVDGRLKGIDGGKFNYHHYWVERTSRSVDVEVVRDCI